MSWKRVQFLSTNGESTLNSSMTLNLNSGMSATEINAKIEMLPKYIPTGKSITIQFADGTYTLDATLYISNFWGPGNLYINGNTGESSSLHSTQAVILSFVAANVLGVLVLNVKCPIQFRFIRIDAATSTGKTGLQLQDVNNFWCAYSYFKGNGTGGAGYMVYGLYARAIFEANYIDNSYCALLLYQDGQMLQVNNSSLVANAYGWIVIGAAFFGTTGTAPGGSTAFQQGGQGA